MQQPEPIIGYYLYDVDSARQKRLSAPRAPCGLNNEAVERIYERRLSGITPEDWRNDPYLVCLLLSLAQFQWYQGKTKGQKVFPVSISPPVAIGTHPDQTIYPGASASHQRIRQRICLCLQSRCTRRTPEVPPLSIAQLRQIPPSHLHQSFFQAIRHLPGTHRPPFDRASVCL